MCPWIFCIILSYSPIDIADQCTHSCSLLLLSVKSFCKLFPLNSCRFFDTNDLTNKIYQVFVSYLGRYIFAQIWWNLAEFCDVFFCPENAYKWKWNSHRRFENSRYRRIKYMIRTKVMKKIECVTEQCGLTFFLDWNWFYGWRWHLLTAERRHLTQWLNCTKNFVRHPPLSVTQLKIQRNKLF